MNPSIMNDLKVYNPEVKIVAPFTLIELADIRNHVEQVRRIFDFEGSQYHDSLEFNRWAYHNLPVLKKYHHQLTDYASNLFGIKLKPSYCFLSMYGDKGKCPGHRDRPQCQFTIDLQVSSDGAWPIYVNDERYLLTNGEALAYSGTFQFHYRKPMRDDSMRYEDYDKPITYMNMAFFHFVPESYMGPLD